MEFSISSFLALIGQLYIDVCRYQSNDKSNCKHRKRETKLDIPEIQNNQTTTKDETNQRSDISNNPHNSYLQQFVYCVLSIMDYTISFCICQVLFSNLTRKFLYQIFPFVFVIIILIVNILYLYRNNYHLYFVKNKSRGYFTTTFCIQFR